MSMAVVSTLSGGSAVFMTGPCSFGSAFQGPTLHQYCGDPQMHSESSDGFPTAQVILDAPREDYILARPHSSLHDRTPAAVGNVQRSGGRHVAPSPG